MSTTPHTFTQHNNLICSLLCKDLQSTHFSKQMGNEYEVNVSTFVLSKFRSKIIRYLKTSCLSTICSWDKLRLKGNSNHYFRLLTKLFQVLSRPVKISYALKIQVLTNLRSSLGQLNPKHSRSSLKEAVSYHLAARRCLIK